MKNYYSHYLVKPKERFQDLISQRRYSDPSFLLNPTLWSRLTEIGANWQETDYLTMAKLISIADVVDKAKYLERKGKPELLSDLLGAPPYSVTLFDQWWTIEHFQPGLVTDDVFVRDVAPIMAMFLVSDDPCGECVARWTKLWHWRPIEKWREYWAYHKEHCVLFLKFYPVTPKQSLLDLLARYPGMTLGAPRVWLQRDEDEPRSDEQAQARLWNVKFWFLVDLIDQAQQQPELQRLVLELLGQPPYRLSDFDRWWAMERIPLGGGGWGIEHTVQNSLPMGILELFAKTGNPLVDAWVEASIALIREKRKASI